METEMLADDLEAARQERPYRAYGPALGRDLEAYGA